MKTIIDGNHKGWGRTLSYLLAAGLAFATAQTARAAKFWKGTTNYSSANGNNWSDKTPSDGSRNGYFARWGQQNYTRAGINFKSYWDTGSNSWWVDDNSKSSHAFTFNCNSGDSSTYAFGIKTTGNLYVGYADASYGYGSGGYLKITSGKYQFGKICIGSCVASKSNSGELDVIGSSTITLTASSGMEINKGSANFDASGKTITMDGDVVLGTTAGYSGVLTISGGTVTVKNSKWTKSTAGNGTINLNGGTYKTQHFQDEVAGGSLTVNFNGGTLQANAAHANGLFTHGAGEGLNVNVGADGGTIHTGGFDISIPVAINDASGASGTLTFNGSGSVRLGAAGDFSGTIAVDGTSLRLDVALAASAYSVTSGTLDCFTYDTAVSTYAIGSLTLGEKAVLPLDVDATGCDTFSATETNITATVENPATFKLIVRSMPVSGQVFPLFAMDEADTNKVNVVAETPAGATFVCERGYENGFITYAIIAKDYVWNATQSNWGDTGAWDVDNDPSDWADSNVAIFNAANAEAALSANVTAVKLDFQADARVAAGGGTLTATEVSVAPSVSATVSAPTAGALVKTGEGTLTLGASRTDNTTLSEGTLVMSGEGTTLDWTKFTFGTDIAKPVTLRFEDGATVANASQMRFGETAGMTNTVYKECGDWNISGNFLMGLSDGPEQTFYHNDGTLTVGGYLSVGDFVGGAGVSRLEINGGTVNSTHTGNYAAIGSQSDGVAIVRNGGAFNVTGSLLVGNKAAGTLTIDNGGVVNVADIVFAYDNTGRDSRVELKTGGELSVNRIYYRNGTSAADTFLFNGGTIKCKYATLVSAHDRLYVKVAADGGVIDLQGRTVAIEEPILEDAESTGGGMEFKGGGVVTLASGNTYTGTTTVELGTTVHVPAPGDIGGGLAVAVPADAPADGVYTLLACDGNGVFTDAVLSGVAAPDGSRLLVTAGGKSVVCIYGDDPGAVWIGGTSGSLSVAANWANGAVPEAGTNCVIGNVATATLTVGDTFAASSITFAADSAAITIDGEDVITGISAITNLSSASHTINVPVYFTGDIQVKQNAQGERAQLSNSHVTFAGGAFAADGYSLDNAATPLYSHCIFGRYSLANPSNSRWTATIQGGNNRLCVADSSNSSLYIPYAGRLTELYVGAGAKVFVGDMALDGRLMYQMGAGGEMVVTNLTVTGADEERYVSYNQGTSNQGVFKFKRVTNSLTGNKSFHLADANAAAKHVFYIGEGGLNYSSSATVYYIGLDKDNNAETIRPWYSNFTIGDRGNGAVGLRLLRNVEFNTSDESDTGRTITIDAITCAQNAPVVTVSGKGTLKVNKAAQNSAQPTVTVKDTATLAFKSGASLGTGATMVNEGATLAVAESGTVTLGNLTLDDGATLAFNFTDRTTAPILAVSSVTANGTVKVKVSGKDSSGNNVWPKAGEYTLTDGGGFTGVSSENISLADDKPDWATGVSVNDAGDIVLQVKARGFSIQVR